MKEFLTNLQEVFFPDPKKKNCPYCGGSKCFGLCGMQGDQTRQPGAASSPVAGEDRQPVNNAPPNAGPE